MSEPNFRVVVDPRNGTFALRGDLDRRSAEGLRETLAAARMPLIVLDLAQLKSIDDAGIASIAATAQHHDHIVLRGALPHHLRLIETVNSRPEFIIEAPPVDVRSPSGSRSALPPRQPKQTPRPLTSSLSTGGLGL